MRACILGPPAVGKTSIVAALCKNYKLHHILIKDVIDEAIEALVSTSNVYIVALYLMEGSTLYGRSTPKD